MATALGLRTGFSVGGEFVSSTAVNQSADYNSIIAVGATMARVDLNWASIEATPGTYNWVNVDGVMARAAGAGVSILALLTYAPLWATDSTTTTHAFPLPAFLGAWRDFCRTASYRYGDQVMGWEIWNEPNKKGSAALSSVPVPKPKRYGKIFTQAVTGIRRFSDAPIITGGVSPATTSTDGGDWSPADWYAALFGYGLTGYDGLGIHPYCWDGGTVVPGAGPSWSTWQQMIDLHAIYPSANWWATEWGAPTSTMAGQYPGQSEAFQLSTAQAGLIEVAANSWITYNFIYRLRDTSPQTAIDQFMGILNYNRTEKTAHDQIQTQLLA